MYAMNVLVKILVIRAATKLFFFTAAVTLKIQGLDFVHFLPVAILNVNQVSKV